MEKSWISPFWENFENLNRPFIKWLGEGFQLCKSKISSFAFLKISLFKLLYFSRYWNIIRFDPFAPVSKTLNFPLKRKKYFQKIFMYLLLKRYIWKLKNLHPKIMHFTNTKDVYYFRYVIHPLFHLRIHPFEWPKFLIYNSNIVKLNAT